MKYLVSRFWGNESGAITIDWVILAAGVIGLAIASMGVVIDGTASLSSDVNTSSDTQGVSTSF
ncbi:pilus assembly protein [uncultured Litoreibacter sp.]|uniref:Flp family type IVb pilin n=1 Tax=uncultured Litoreibacter sp. TaxID=1392394 RepID=UPI002621B0F0|nr:pilus assembly protein [uncultured Litoreibacter sp.]